MALVNCETLGCPHQVVVDTEDQLMPHEALPEQLADGVFCWRCRRRQARAHAGAARTDRLLGKVEK